MRKNPNLIDQLVDTREAAEVLGVGPARVRYLIRSATLVPRARWPHLSLLDLAEVRALAQERPDIGRRARLHKNRAAPAT